MGKKRNIIVGQSGGPTSVINSSLARIGLGIAFVPDFCIPQNDEELFILDLKEQLPSRQMMVAYNESLPVSQAARQFMDML